MTNKFIVFDLDDTLYKEIYFLKSAYREISTCLMEQFGLAELYDEMLEYYNQGRDVFKTIIDVYGIPIEKDCLLGIYRNHIPNISLDRDTIQTLDDLRRESSCRIGLITDGRLTTQMNKINALGLKQWIREEDILISEVTGHTKPDEYAFRVMEMRYNSCDFVYVGDNPQKDFLAPNKMGWVTICLKDDGRNIHQQSFNLDSEWIPNTCITNIGELIRLIK